MPSSATPNAVQYWNDNDIIVNRKAHAAIDAGLYPIVCVGESKEQRELGVTKEVIDLQVKTALSGIPAEKIRHVVIAYEPLWAIGTGDTATAEQANEVCEEIRTVIRKLYGARVARSVTILYGGSMNENNAHDLLAQPDVDGGLIGGASLVPKKFNRDHQPSQPGIILTGCPYSIGQAIPARSSLSKIQLESTGISRVQRLGWR